MQARPTCVRLDSGRWGIEMPLYEYKCADCETSFEKLTRHAVADSVICPQCGGTHARRLISVFASFSQSTDGSVTPVATGGCGCGGHCACGGH
jgi:putative FmdB family regulatory protein